MAWATTYAARAFLLGQDIGRRPSTPTELPSPEYVFGRVRGAKAECMSGIGMLDALDVLTNEGVVSLTDYPYGGKTCLLSPPTSLKEKASLLRIGGWRSVQRKVPDDWRTPIVLDDVKAQLSQGYPVVFAMPASPAFMAMNARSGIYSAEVAEGPWHALAIVGYDEEKQAIRVMNSWGRGWGQEGYGWISYDTFARLAGEAYVLLPRNDASLAKVPASVPAPLPDNPNAAIWQRLHNTDCSSLKLETTGGHRTVTGFGGLPSLLEQTKAAVTLIDPALIWKVQTHPWPQCEAEITLADALPDSPVKLVIAGADGQPLVGAPVTLRKDQLFAVNVETDAAKPFVHVIYVQADGSAVELYRGEPVPDASGRRRVDLGSSGGKAARFKVGGPFGDEMIVALASPTALFGDELGSQATDREFLTLMRAHVINATQHNKGVSAAVLRLRTSAS